MVQNMHEAIVEIAPLSSLSSMASTCSYQSLILPPRNISDGMKLKNSRCPKKIRIHFSTVMIPLRPGPAFQECTGSCHKNVPTLKVVSSDLRSTDGLTVLARIEIVAILVSTLSTILQHFTHNEIQ